MRLELAWSEIAAVAGGAATRLVGRALEIDLPALGALLEADPRLARVRLDLAHPGESCRIAPVFDVFAPRARGDGARWRAPAAGGRARWPTSPWWSPTSSSATLPRLP